MSSTSLIHSVLANTGFVVLLAAGSVQPATAQTYTTAQPYAAVPPAADAAQAPGRVARLAYVSGQVQWAPAGEDAWGTAELNRPLMVGDRLLTGDAARAVLELGDAAIRLAGDSAFDFLNLDSTNVQVELSQGTLNLVVRRLDAGTNLEVDTPTVAFVAATPGVYRIDDNPDGTGTMVTVFAGAGTVYGENGASHEVAAGTSYRFNDVQLASVDVAGLPESDAFDQFCETRDARQQRYAEQPQYVPPDMLGGAELDQYGSWDEVPEYGRVWYPNQVPTGWTPYRYGHWVWAGAWGWTWVDDQPWGFAPFHYGRWVHTRNRWGWMPGPINLRPIYAPALVAFVGNPGLSVSLRVGGGGPVGWFPLGPRDVYVPWFHASHGYFTGVNITNLRRRYVNHTTINRFYANYHAGRGLPVGRHEYAYQHLAGAVTAVPRNIFTGARPVHPAALRMDHKQLAGSHVTWRPGINPDRSSLGLRRARTQPAIRPGREPFTRPIVARHAPAPRPTAFRTRETLRTRQPGQPLGRAPRVHDTDAGRIRLVPGSRHDTGATRTSTPTRATPPPRRPNEPPARARAFTPARNGVNAAPTTTREQTRGTQPHALPNPRHTPRREPAPLPRVPALRPDTSAPRPRNPASQHLPVVRPVERAQQSTPHRAPVSPRARQPYVQPQRDRQTQGPARALPRMPPTRAAPAREAPYAPELRQRRPPQQPASQHAPRPTNTQRAPKHHAPAHGKQDTNDYQQRIR